ncbi:hypothetical protein JH06_0720 [Blastocystis sp. subtype 4]|uniref:hypothetical protein n=1 Tax=Blastocystis sp. subtype 4 TaxID=944170 RepID=UPI000711DE02|nr:hypothetical protein JH06_0720 [Blastocystis sp. subtype 4]KNB45659.1 hypothetical protein JH06_0720 [Blastocystis sp. subtype 4]|eukprot:XP_014529102.1 hypothetical protein JH06_0720 [Blastocystis sp. subtype 4]
MARSSLCIKSRSRDRKELKRRSRSRSYSYSDYSYSSRSPSPAKHQEHGHSEHTKDKEKKMVMGPDGVMIEKEEANYKVTGALGKDKNTGVMYNGVLLKWCEPADAAKPNLKWRVYEFKDGKIVDTKYLHRCSAFLIGRDERVCDWILLHESISKQHAVFQFRKVPLVLIQFYTYFEFRRMVIKPYIMDLDSTNGTFLNGKKIEGSRYYELREGDELKFGFSTRSYILLNENSVDTTEAKPES